MKCLRLLFISFLFVSLTSFDETNQSIKKLQAGELAPDFYFKDTTGKECSLNKLRGKYVLLNFWASYDAASRIRNIYFSNKIQTSNEKIELVSVSFDKYPSIFNQTVKTDGIKTTACFIDTAGIKSGLYKEYQLNKGFKNYLLDKEGKILASDINPSDISFYIKKHQS